MQISLITSTLLTLFVSSSWACSRVTYNSTITDGNRITTGRSMDWFMTTNASIWTFPAGMSRNGAAGANSLTWTSKYGSVITAMYDAAVVDGINSKGLTGNFLYLANANYGTRKPSLPGISVGAWLQYFLDSYATVDEAANDLYTAEGREKFQVVTAELIPGTPSLGHISLTDESGDNLILEYLDGVLTVHHGLQYTVMTNSPSYYQQLAIMEYWLPIGNQSLPGTRRPADRFARLSYYNNVTAPSSSLEESVAITASMIRAVSVPITPSLPGEPDVATTLWRTYADTRALKYFWESTVQPMFLWIDLGDFDLSIFGQVMLLDLQVSPYSRVGNMKGKFVPSAPFPFFPVGGS
ncbi:uncharacterized protein A1O9_07275 [Exophiala aquamarina CBS 119918]|uniref:Choloylglycine hydrolase/NAAA C-terminal domain-containing protein n=1 Tax=Exophiala aquamarina CBS 119918 TaxID=1182545 RepID=A0A072PNH3_9EURO|nr:uncharacterized protein A1O9_07275 [Exophiala aquamarina CBS 119918]KEF57085.1 hypothetical protein A1O9_07275 [Exophiala aquamarina CBS 119918]